MRMDQRKERFIKAYYAGYGIIASACEAVGIGRSTYYRWRDEDPEFRARVEEIGETQVDFVESKLMQLINANDTTAIIFYLKTKGKSRGYSQAAQSAVPKPAQSALPSTDKEQAKMIANKVKSKKGYIVKLLKQQNKYTAELTYQVDIAAKLLVRADMLSDEILADGHRSVNVEYSREGNKRITVDPKERLYLDVLEKSQKALRALGMNTESKDKGGGQDYFSDFIQAVNAEDEE